MSARLCQDGEFGGPPGRFAPETGLQRPGVSGQARAVQTPHSSLPGKDTLHSGRLTDRIRRRGSSPHTDTAKSKHSGGVTAAGEKGNYFIGDEWMKGQSAMRVSQAKKWIFMGNEARPWMNYRLGLVEAPFVNPSVVFEGSADGHASTWPPWKP